MNQDDNVDFYKSNHPDDPETPDIPSGRNADRGRAERPSSERFMSWTAPEYIEFERRGDWYIGLAAATAALAVGLYYLSKDYFAIGSIIVVAIIMAVFVARKPHDINFQLSDSGIEIGNRRYNFSLFKSFTIVRQGALSSVELLPLKRFMPPVSACFAPEDEEQVVSIVGEHLPYVEHRPGAVERLSQRLRL